ncbi:hypothetical protein FBU31_006188 [Coemansia sp. 'formosensis']|nr:hypothetical protein FBU31_006188 [Coemansia sp. 'formosensis']
MDEEDYEASRRSQSSSNRSEGEMRQLAQSMLSMNIQDKSAEYFMIAGLIKQIAELKQGGALSQQHRNELSNAKLLAETERKRADKAEDAIDDLEAELARKESSLVYYKNEVNRLNILSDRHRDHINSLNRNVEARKETIRELEDEAETTNKKLEWYVEEHGDIPDWYY